MKTEKDLEILKKASITAAQRRQILKQDRRKKFKDLAIQDTNNSSIASKRSVEKLYLPKLDWNKSESDQGNGNETQLEYFKYFVRKGPKRSPCINRGYWLRLHAIRSRLDSIIGGTSGNILIINLGCGYDPLAFQLLDKKNVSSRMYHERVSFLDIDYEEMIATKSKIIRETAELSNITGKEIPTSSDFDSTEYNSPKYKTKICNLNDSKSFNNLIQTMDISDSNLIKVFIAEVSLAYMAPEKADEIIQICGNLEKSHFIIMEQLIPQGVNEPFSKQMLKHFKKNDSPLQCVLKYQTIESQKNRFEKLNFNYVNAGDMFQLWLQTSDELISKVEKIQPFDELEEFHLFSHHYILCHATNDSEFVFTPKYKFVDNKSLDKQFKIYNDKNVKIRDLGFDIKRRFGTSIMSENYKNIDSIIYNSGCNPARLDSTIKIGLDVEIDNFKDNIELLENNSDTGLFPTARMCHSFTTLSDTEAIVIGGRTGPNQSIWDSWIYHLETRKWRKINDSLTSRYRHASCSLGKDRILVVGGVVDAIDNNKSIFAIYDKTTNKIECCEPQNSKGSCIKTVFTSLVSSAIASLRGISGTTTVAIIGGESDGKTIQDTLTIYSYKDKMLRFTRQFQCPLFKRYGSQIAFIDDTHILIVGGTSDTILFGQDSTIAIADITTGEAYGVHIPDSIWENSPICFVGSSLQRVSSNKFVIVGGGATCYGFGSISSNIFELDISL
ncbi:hypothetical protein TBLA_0H00180 [Henningerozyma blattae CBS 6284]|uniref:tRNA wybutosine-synthesizing protein 4 n=1 Tax=Henningerozyma blattae (strain ATCC 34711 / CBS 6284 / DSM 70876 / NBRC 10599 / NRRL Y-10934 / UCD 77-7) TaxID=1071380 RepID=I2H7F9_HENB6|nr:hypothetical protein TBLA_0H00180 [Tetrapisispora blattae CBS 6284]CCH62311.1 hypothetical protein TBLA_0H00180 [Tetrapisispora blattae CBS 6284]